MTKLLFIDTETTGLDAKRNDIITLSGVIEDTEQKFQPVSFNYEMQPYDYNTIQQTALDINKLTVEKIKTFEQPNTAVGRFIALLDNYVDRYDKNDKFTVVGYNVKFDLEFLRVTFEKAGEKYFGSYINGYPIDVYELLKYLNIVKGWNVDKQNLWRYVEMYNLKLEGQEFHNSMSDILYTRQLFYLINQNYIK